MAYTKKPRWSLQPTGFTILLIFFLLPLVLESKLLQYLFFAPDLHIDHSSKITVSGGKVADAILSAIAVALVHNIEFLHAIGVEEITHNQFSLATAVGTTFIGHADFNHIVEIARKHAGIA